ncbi:MAG: UDP-2,3-diacylglucosamine diphosphatase LpxI [Desulfarculaceae bacterium]|nr:UDP-2,3-diacylglucosamine diphosphatase LpxI [Desulfarculaceae bacterium]MCF8072243.1 UDP-2,3-diacylglucosamine diphosphatase LpxI [Desulfarculaceae bacterium]MCF8100164.1 UDP-2,3-diacylglucosamine diphosphatase LpxI [Desulfarculaceae bacterium]MCF8117893.1 UDP-2,3-diacylglucosamine diphosphatase LpxI [Desulfarculaceae bacterium]
MSGRTIGLIAGKSQFPILFARAARAQGHRVVAVAFKGETMPELELEVDSLVWVQLGQLGKLMNALKDGGVTQAVMAGGVTKPRMFDLRPDLKALGLIKKIRHMADDGILRTFAEYLSEHGIEILPSHVLVPELLANEGQYTGRGPTDEERQDIEVGWQAAGELGRLDIGQCVVVRGKAVVAVEAMEGTDACIRRGGQLAGGREAVVVKRCKPNQDIRFDLPSVGAGTIEVMAEAGASCLVVESWRTLFFDPAEAVRQAEAAGICILGREAGEGVS